VTRQMARSQNAGPLESCGLRGEGGGIMSIA